MIVELLKDKYWSKSTAFLLPLTGVKEREDFQIESYLYWEDYSIEDYLLTVKVEYGHKYDEFKDYLRETIFKGGKALVKECFDYEGFSILIVDMAEWFEDIEIFLKGKYSKLSNNAKRLIEDYHLFYEGKKAMINIGIYSCLYPEKKQELLGDKTPIQYIIENYIKDKTSFTTDVCYELDTDSAKYIENNKEVCSICDKKEETLSTEGQNDIDNRLD